MKRRGFLAGLLAAPVALPLVVKAGETGAPAKAAVSVVDDNFRALMNAQQKWTPYVFSNSTYWLNTKTGAMYVYDPDEGI